MYPNSYYSHNSHNGQSASVPYSASVAGDSVFSDYSMASDYSLSTVASMGTEISRPDTIVEEAANPVFLGMAGQLPCEFIGYSGCDLAYPLDETQSWIDHIIEDHLRNKLPRKAICWFCDDFAFDAKREKIDERTNFENRMHHIRDHFLDGTGSINGMRPDHHLNDHLGQYKLVPTETFMMVQRTNEVRIPRGLIPLNTLPHELALKEERKTYVYNNPHDEERMFRRQQKKKDKVRSRQ